MSNQELFSNLKCTKCGIIESNLSIYKKRGHIPTCNKCRKRFKITTFTNIPFYLLLVASCGFLVFIMINLILAAPYGPFNLFNESWFVIISIVTVVMIVIIIILIILRRLFGANLKNYFKGNGEPYIKSEIDPNWLSYREWIIQTLLERNISEDQISKLIENEIIHQKTIKLRRKKIGLFWMLSGLVLFTLGIVSLIYGYYLSTLQSSYLVWSFFIIVHLPPSSVPLFIGILNLIIGSRKRKYYNLV